MISSILLHNFETHRDLQLDLSEITSITGETDIGKSSIIRALTWVLSNEAPKGIISWGERECWVEIEVDGHVLRRYKSNRENYYVLDGTKYCCLKRGIPEEIDKILNVSGSSLQSQFDNFFWISNTGGQLAEELNKIVDLSIIDDTFSELNSRIRFEKTHFDILSDQVKQSEQSLEKFEGLEEIETAVQVISKKESDLNGKNAEISSIFPKIFSLHSCNDKISLLDKANSVGIIALEKISRLKKVMEEKEYLRKTISKLNEISKLKDTTELEMILQMIEIRSVELSSIQRKISAIRRITKKLSNVPEVKDTSDLESLVSDIEEKQSLVKSKKVEFRKISKIVSSLKKIDLKKILIKIQECEEKFHEGIKGKCPLCGRQ